MQHSTNFSKVTFDSEQHHSSSRKKQKKRRKGEKKKKRDKEPIKEEVFARRISPLKQSISNQDGKFAKIEEDHEDDHEGDHKQDREQEATGTVLARILSEDVIIPAVHVSDDIITDPKQFDPQRDHETGTNPLPPSLNYS